MPVFRRFHFLCIVTVSAALLSGCSTMKKGYHSVTGLFTKDAPAEQQPVATDTAEQAKPAEPAPVTETAEPMPEAMPTEPAAEVTTPEPTTEPAPEAEPAAPVEDAMPLPPAEPIVFEDQQPEAPASDAPPAPAEPQTFEVLVPEGDYVFVPRQLTIYEGDTVEWRNASGLVHLFASIPGSDPSGHMELEPVDLLVGAQVTHVFNTAGTYPYFCFIHNRMTGKIVVLPR